MGPQARSEELYCPAVSPAPSELRLWKAVVRSDPEGAASKAGTQVKRTQELGAEDMEVERELDSQWLTWSLV